MFLEEFGSSYETIARCFFVFNLIELTLGCDIPRIVPVLAAIA